MVTPSPSRLSGIVEVDENSIGGEKTGKRGHGAAGKALIVIAAEVNDSRIGRMRLRHGANASSVSRECAVQEAADKGSVIVTDGGTGYSRVSRLGYAHEVVRTNATVGENLLPSCHRVASVLKRWLMGTHHSAVSHEHLDYYLDAFTSRFNSQASGEIL